MLTLLVAAATAHVPFFPDAGSVQTLDRDAHVSQVYYWQGQGVVVGKSLDGVLVSVVTRDANPRCSATITCDGVIAANMSRTFASPGGATAEPFTQTSYREVMETTLSCTESFNISGDCNTPWGIVVGALEEFSGLDIIALPVTVFRLHGKSWNGEQDAAMVVIGVVAAAALVVLFLDLRWDTKFLYLAALVALAWGGLKAGNAAKHANSAAAWAVAVLPELGLIAAVAWLYYFFRTKANVAEGGGLWYRHP
jgi:hypothetical protein